MVHAAGRAEPDAIAAGVALLEARGLVVRHDAARGPQTGYLADRDDVRCAQEECEAARVAFIQREAAAGGALLAIKLVFNHVQRQGYSKEV